MLKHTDIPCFNPEVLKRYEENIDGGTFFVYNVKSQKMWHGNYSSYLVLRNIDCCKSIDDICIEAEPYFDASSHSQLYEAVCNIIDDLYGQGFISVKHGK